MSSAFTVPTAGGCDISPWGGFTPWEVATVTSSWTCTVTAGDAGGSGVDNAVVGVWRAEGNVGVDGKGEPSSLGCDAMLS